MARIRTIKPEHWEDDSWDKVSLQAHLLWIAMKNFADDKGVIRDNTILIKNKVFPTREDIRTSEVQKWIKELIENFFLVPLVYESKGYYVLNFSQERIDKPQPSVIPDSFFEKFNIQEHSIVFANIPEQSGIENNIPAVKESIGEVKEKDIGKEKEPPSALDVAFLDFLEMRKKIKKPATDRAIELLHENLEKLSSGNESLKIKLLEQSTVNCWQDLYPLKQGDNGKNNQRLKPNGIEPGSKITNYGKL